jgi:hypothetical protein
MLPKLTGGAALTAQQSTLSIFGMCAMGVISRQPSSMTVGFFVAAFLCSHSLDCSQEMRVQKR